MLNNPNRAATFNNRSPTVAPGTGMNSRANTTVPNSHSPTCTITGSPNMQKSPGPERLHAGGINTPFESPRIQSMSQLTRSPQLLQMPPLPLVRFEEPTLPDLMASARSAPPAPQPQ